MMTRMFRVAERRAAEELRPVMELIAAMARLHMAVKDDPEARALLARIERLEVCDGH